MLHPDLNGDNMCPGIEKEIEMHTQILKTATLTAVMIGGLMTMTAMADTGFDATDDIAWTLSVEVAEGQDDAFNTLMAEMVSATKDETGVKSYEWHRSGNIVHINERYETNEDAGARAIA